MSEHVQYHLIQAKKSHALRRVPVLLSSLCRIIEGQKTIYGDPAPQCADHSQVILMAAGRELTVANHPGAQGYVAEVISFSPQLMHDFCRKFAEQLALKPAAAPKLCMAIDAHFEAAWQNLRTSLINDSPAALQEYHAYGVLLALVLAGQSIVQLMHGHTSVSADVQQILLLDPAFAWTVEDVATRLHMGASTLRRKLMLEHKSFREILEEVRLGVALNQLQTTQQPIALISDACGYSSASKLAQRFRLRYGISPSTLRKAM